MSEESSPFFMKSECKGDILALLAKNKFMKFKPIKSSSFTDYELSTLKCTLNSFFKYRSIKFVSTIPTAYSNLALIPTKCSIVSAL